MLSNPRAWANKLQTLLAGQKVGEFFLGDHEASLSTCKDELTVDAVSANVDLTLP